MSISIATSKKILGQIATNKGYKDMATYIITTKDAETMLTLKQFIKTGETKFPKMVASQAHILATKCSDTNNRNTLMNLSTMMDKQAGHILVVTG